MSIVPAIAIKFLICTCQNYHCTITKSFIDIAKGRVPIKIDLVTIRMEKSQLE